MKVRNEDARSYVGAALRGLTVLAVSSTLLLGGVVTTPARAVAAPTVSPAQAAKDSAARAARYAAHKARVKAQAAADAKARAARAARRKARALADAKARAARNARHRAAMAKAGPQAATVGGWYKAKVSWYGPGFYGHGMAGGGVLQANSMVVAHRSLPFGTRVQFAYAGKTVTAVVRDRGPFIAGRMFDLGPGTAKAIGFDRVGVGVVQYRILK